MRLKHLCLTFCLLATAALYANGTLESSSAVVSRATCTLPAPNNYHIVAIGPSSVDLAWDYQADAVGGYRIRTYRVSDHALISTVFRPQDTPFATITGLTPGEEYSSVINSREENGSDSPNEKSLPFHTVILDLIVNGYTGSNNSQSCTIENGGNLQCDISTTILTPFKVVKTSNNVERQFGISRRLEGSALKYKCYLGTAKSEFTFYCDNGGTSNCSTTNITITYKPIYGPESFVASFSVSEVTNYPLLICNSIAPGYQIISMLPQMRPGAPSVQDRGNDVPGLSAMAFPNPFSENLEVSLANAPQSAVHLKLCNLQGQVVLEQSFEAGMEQYSLSTPGLSPGFYLLRIEADGAIQTLKVIKSE